MPVHGEYRQLHHHAELAVAAGIPKERVFLAEDGNVIEVTPEGLKKTADNVSGLVYVDGLGIGDVGQAVLRDRQHLAADGLVVATVGVDRDTGAIRLGPEVTSRGFIASGAEADLQEEATRAVAAAVARAGRRPDRSLLQEAVHDAVSQLLWKKTGRRPMVVPLVTEV